MTDNPQTPSNRPSTPSGDGSRGAFDKAKSALDPKGAAVNAATDRLANSNSKLGRAAGDFGKELSRDNDSIGAAVRTAGKRIPGGETKAGRAAVKTVDVGQQAARAVSGDVTAIKALATRTAKNKWVQIALVLVLLGTAMSTMFLFSVVSGAINSTLADGLEQKADKAAEETGVDAQTRLAAKYMTEGTHVGWEIPAAIHFTAKDSGGSGWAGVECKKSEDTSSAPAATDLGKKLPRFISDATFTNDGKYVLLKLAEQPDVVVLDASTWAEVGTIKTPSVEQGESIAMDSDGQSFIITSEGEGSPVVRTPLPSEFGGPGGAGRKVSTIKDGSIIESSGVVVSASDPDIAYTHNDQKDYAGVVAFKISTGQTVGKVDPSGADNKSDTESIRIAPDGKIWLGDIGNGHPNQAEMEGHSADKVEPASAEKKVGVFIYDEPAAGASGNVAATFKEFTYPGGPQNSEALLIHPTTGKAYVLTKDLVGKVYELPFSSGDSSAAASSDPCGGSSAAAESEDNSPWLMAELLRIVRGYDDEDYQLDRGAQADGYYRYINASVSDSASPAAQVEKFWVTALSKLPLAGNPERAQQVFDIARTWSLGNVPPTCSNSNLTPVVLPNGGGWVNPAKGKISARFGQKGTVWSAGYHTGIDVGGKTGEPIFAASAGKVTTPAQGWAGPNFVQIDHGGGIFTWYGHMSKRMVEKGDTVQAGQQIGKMGALGNVTSGYVHLHFETHTGPKWPSDAVDPDKFMKERGVEIGTSPVPAALSDLEIGPDIGGAGGLPESDEANDSTDASDPEVDATEASDTKSDDEASSATTETVPVTLPATSGLPDSLTVTNAKGGKVTLDTTRLGFAATAVAKGKELKANDQALTVMLMTALLESGIQNYGDSAYPATADLAYPKSAKDSDRDSVGLFQQRPSSGWGPNVLRIGGEGDTPKNRELDAVALMEPATAAAAFLGGDDSFNKGSPAGLFGVKGWEAMSLGEAATHVQNPQAVGNLKVIDAYAIWEPAAKELLAAVAGASPIQATIQQPANCDESSAGGETPTALGDRSGDSPNAIFDLGVWKLTLPTVEEIEQPKLNTFMHKEWFHMDTTKTGVVFNAPAGAGHTKGSSYPRTELREMKPDAWDSAKGTHTMVISQAITHLPNKKNKVVAGQIHDDEDDVLRVVLEGSKLYASFSCGKGCDLPYQTIDPSYKLGTKFQLGITATAAGIDVTYNGAKKAHLGRKTTGNYFKAGAYVLSDQEGDGYGEVIIYGLVVKHN